MIVVCVILTSTSLLESIIVDFVEIYIATIVVIDLNYSNPSIKKRLEYASIVMLKIDYPDGAQ
jgi:hypothetical protein